MDMIKALRFFPLLKNVDEEELIVLSGKLKEEIHDVGEEIITEGEDGQTMYILIEGRVDIIKKTVFGEEFVCATLDDNAHAVFGEMALIDADKRSATVRARTACRTLSIDTDAFKDFCHDYPRSGVELLLLISTNLVRNVRAENEKLQLVYQALIDEIESN